MKNYESTTIGILVVREREIQPSFWMHRDVFRESQHLFSDTDRVADLVLLRSKLEKIGSDFGDLRHRFGARKLGDPGLESPTDLREIAADSGDDVLILFIFGRFVIGELRGV